MKRQKEKALNAKHLLWMTLIFLQACIPELSFDIPEPEIRVEDIRANTRISALIDKYAQSGEEIHTFSQSEEGVVEVLLVSSDEAGNFYKRMIVQDAEGNDIRGLSVLVDLRSYYTRYQLGSKLYIKLAGLSLFGDRGSYSLGFRDMDRIKGIPESLLDRFLIRSGTRIEFETEFREANSLDERDINTRVRIGRAQFEREDLDKSFAAEPYDAYNALRPLKLCEGQAPLFLSTSVYADFKLGILPDSTFILQGILTREYEDQLALVVNDPDDIILVDSDRCDDEFLLCDSADEWQNLEPGTNSSGEVLFYENFESIQSTRDLTEIGWTNANIHFGNGKFVKRTSNDNTFVRVSAYGTQESTMDVWLISPQIDMDLTREEVLFFDSRATFNEGRLLSIWISTDFEQDVEGANWRRVEARISEGSSDGTNERFISSGGISLDCVEGKMRIAFRYLGGDPGPSTNYDLDNVLIKGLWNDPD